MPRDAILVENLVKDYPTRKGVVRALSGVSFRVEEGEIVGLLGPNGAGKTTIIKILCGLVHATFGKAEVFGVLPHRPEVGRYVAAVLEGSRNVYWRLSVLENLRFFAGLQGIPAGRPTAAPKNFSPSLAFPKRKTPWPTFFPKG
jgi:ABC-2 type transport system ATP-binding protein